MEFELSTLVEKLKTDVLAHLKSSFVGKEEVVELMGVALMAGENLFLFGPPGTAKSSLVHQLGSLIDGQTFDYLLTRFTEPNELFGPFDIRKLREGELITNTEGMLPEASLVFLDELLNANSAILNTLLNVLNEKVFRRGRETKKLPLLMTIAASNHLPEDDALRALFDRFLLRVHCDYVPEENLSEVLQAGWALEKERKTINAAMTVEGIQFLQSQLQHVDLSTVVPAYLNLIHRLRQAGVEFSDRRAVKLQKVIAASALLSGRKEASPSDLWVLRYIWDTEEQREVIANIIQNELAKFDQGNNEHPSARQSTAPDPEQLNEELEKLATQLKQVDLPEHEKTQLRDRLAQLCQRINWIEGEVQRQALKEKSEKIWHEILEVGD